MLLIAPQITPRGVFEECLSGEPGLAAAVLELLEPLPEREQWRLGASLLEARSAGKLEEALALEMLLRSPDNGQAN